MRVKRFLPKKVKVTKKLHSVYPEYSWMKYLVGS